VSDTKTKSIPQVTVRKAGAASKQPVLSRALEAEDEFRPYYADDALGAGMALLEPPYNPAILQNLCSQNNTLGPCIDAMETNIDATGYIIEREDGTTPEKDPGSGKLKEFFDEVFPGLSFKALRRKVRRDLEQTGNGYIEVLRNVEGQVMFLRYVPARTVRVMRLDAPIVVEKKVVRDGQEITVPTLIRERRFAQMIGAIWIYFREFGSFRHLNYETGWWDSDTQPTPITKRATEIIHLKVHDHYYTPYGLPRWEGAIPSVLGSRKAEEFNLEFFDTGGLPPALITIAGGSMGEEAKKSLDDQFNSKNRSKHRVAVLETQSTSGSLDSAGKVDIQVHAFGSDRQGDGLFLKYDDASHVKTRRHFRLPPLFVGEIQAQNFSVAFTSYIVAENQVFRPEREAFDDMVNRLIMPEINGKGYVYRSKNLSIADIQTKLAALQIAGATQRVDPRQIVHQINEIADLDLDASDTPIADPSLQAMGEPTITDGSLKSGMGVPGAIKAKVPITDGSFKPKNNDAGLAKTDGFNVLALADEAMLSLRRRDLQSIARVVSQIDRLSKADQQQFKAAMALRSYFDPSVDPESMTELAGCSLVAMMRSEELN
jgi:PBSX family phage portal protein